MPLQQLRPASPSQQVRQLSGLPAGGVVLLEARGLDDAEAAITAVRRNSSVVLQCEHMHPRLAQRLIDMVSGGVCAMDGHERRISAQVMLFLPAAAKLECH